MQARFADPELFEKREPFLHVELAELRLDLRTDPQSVRAGLLCMGLQRARCGVALSQRSLVDVRDVEDGLCGE